MRLTPEQVEEVAASDYRLGRQGDLIDTIRALTAERNEARELFEHMRDGRNALQLERDSLLAELNEAREKEVRKA
jgi:hypothetical protein